MRSAKGPNITVVGSVNVDFVVRVARLPRPGETVSGAEATEHNGGKGANQAVAAARLGASVCLIGCVGDDGFGEDALAQLEHEGVDARLHENAEATGMAFIVVDADGENVIVVAPGANRYLTPDGIEIPRNDSVMCQLEVPIEAVAEAASQTMGSFCLNAAPAGPVPEEILRRADIVIVNRYEYEALGTEPRGLVALTLGEEGAVLLEGGKEIARARPPTVEAVDGTAAGDAFCAAFVVGYLEGRSRQSALQRACAAGAIAASRHGAQPSLPSDVEIDEILSR